MTTAEHFLLTSLHRLATGQDENFITEAFAFVMRFLILNEPASAIPLLRTITGGCIDLSTAEIPTVDIKTQIATDSGRPDMVLSTDAHLVYVEIKVDATFGDRQLARYRSELQRSNIQNIKLVAITRYPFLENTYCGLPDCSFRWHHVADLLNKMPLQSKVSEFVISEFLNLLSSRGLTMEKVSWEMISGVKSFVSLVDMLAEALAAKKISIRNSAAQEWRGFYIVDKQFFVGIYFDNPGVVVFNTEVQLNKKAIENLTLGKIQDSRWRNELHLTTEEVHFFARSRASQVQCLEQFIEESMVYGRTLV